MFFFWIQIGGVNLGHTLVTEAADTLVTEGADTLIT